MALIAITRDVSANIGRCELTHLERQPIDVALARAQHQNYESVLRGLGCSVHSLPAKDEYPDSVFVEDVALVLDEVAILLRPGAASRRGEVNEMATVLQPWRTLHRIAAPGRLDGGDVLLLEHTLYIGETTRSNAAAVSQVKDIVKPLGYEVRTVPVLDALHLKSAVTAITDDAVLLNPQMVQETAFHGLEVVFVHPDEPFAANALRVGQTLIYPEAFPRTAEFLRRRGLRLESIDVSELAKAEGALTCCSLLFEAAPDDEGGG